MDGVAAVAAGLPHPLDQDLLFCFLMPVPLHDGGDFPHQGVHPGQDRDRQQNVPDYIGQRVVGVVPIAQQRRRHQRIQDLPLVSPWVLVSIVDLPKASEMYLWVLNSLPPRYSRVSELLGMVSHESLNCSLSCAMFWMMVLQEMLRERIVASSRGSYGRLPEGASSRMKWTWRGNGPWWI